MARYIDAEALKLNVQRYTIPNVDYDGTVSVENAERYFISLLDKAPTADVVPRSEVEGYIVNMNAYGLTAKRLAEENEELQSRVKRLQSILLQFTDIVHKWGAKNNIDTTEISLVPILEQEANNIIEQAKQEVAKQMIDEFESHISTGIRILKDCINDTDTDQVKRHLLGRLHELCGMEKLIAELKKKYIGE